VKYIVLHPVGQAKITKVPESTIIETLKATRAA